jgi:aspartate aminotransferase
MPVADDIKSMIQNASFIRKMFETGARLKEKFGQENVLDFTLGNPDLEPPKKFQITLRKIVNQKIPLKHGYISNAGLTETRKVVAEKVSCEQHIKISFENIIMTCGAGGGLNVVFKTILNRGDNVIINAPYFVEYGFYINNHGGEISIVNTKSDFNLDIDAIEKKINHKTCAILINSPNNPTGKVYPQTTIKKLCNMLKEKSKKINRAIYLVSDEPYRKIVYDNIKVPSIFEFYSNSIIVTSFSKDLSIPGERLGYIAVHPKADDLRNLIDGMILCNRILGFVNAPVLMQRVIKEIPDACVDIKRYQRRRDLLCSNLKKIGYNFILPEGAFYLFPKAPNGDDIEFVNILREKLVLAVPGTGFGCSGYFRLAYCVPENTIKRAMPILEEVIKKFKK